jgi:uncharacterized protein YdbL (DUF1318 family)
MKTTSFTKAALAAMLLSAGAAALSTAMIAAPAYADVAASKALVDAAKAKGIVGEQNNGYLGFVTPSSDAALKAAVDEINAGRREVYTQAAAKSNVAPDAAGISAFTNVILPKLAAGLYYQDGAGAWVKK